MSKRQALERTAYHEAGHAVAAMIFRRRFRYVTIKSNKEDGTAGHVMNTAIRISKWQHSEGWPEAYRARLEREAMISLAGIAAGHLIDGHHKWYQSHNDLRNAFDMLEPLTRSDEETRRYSDWLKLRVEGILSQPHYLRCVKALAHALLRQETIRYIEARSIMAKALPAMKLGDTKPFSERVAEAIAFAESALSGGN